MSKSELDREPRSPKNESTSWTQLSLDELTDAYWEIIAPALRADGQNPTVDRPTHAWLSANGFRGLVYALREYHDRTFGEFWADDLGLATDEEYAWGITHQPTIALLESYLDSRRTRSDLSESSIQTLRYRLARYVRAYAESNQNEDLLAPIAHDSDIDAHEATSAAWTAFDRLNEELSGRTMRRIHEAVNDWYAHLTRRKRAAINPVAGLDEEYRWSRSTDNSQGQPTNPSLSADQVRTLYASADTASQRLLVVGLCAWGLRSSEVAALHYSQLVLDDSTDTVSYVSFDERKNGPGEVSILYGADAARDVIQQYADADSWSGYLFPSARSQSGHITRQTVLNRFDALAEEANLPGEIDGRKPVPQMGRRFWYDAYSSTQEQLIADVGEIAEEQGSSSAEVVLQDYLSPERRRTLRREYMRQHLAAAFEL